MLVFTQYQATWCGSPLPKNRPLHI